MFDNGMNSWTNSGSDIPDSYYAGFFAHNPIELLFKAFFRKKNNKNEDKK